MVQDGWSDTAAARDRARFHFSHLLRFASRQSCATDNAGLHCGTTHIFCYAARRLHAHILTCRAHKLRRYAAHSFCAHLRFLLRRHIVLSPFPARTPTCRGATAVVPPTPPPHLVTTPTSLHHAAAYYAHTTTTRVPPPTTTTPTAYTTCHTLHLPTPHTRPACTLQPVCPDIRIRNVRCCADTTCAVGRDVSGLLFVRTLCFVRADTGRGYYLPSL